MHVEKSMQGHPYGLALLCHVLVALVVVRASTLLHVGCCSGG
jgi:hypothetical protein